MGEEFKTPSESRADALEAHFGSAVRALYVEGKRGEPDPVGSCVLVQFGPRVFLLTAGHVFHESGSQPLWVAGDEEFVEVQSERLYSVNPAVGGPGSDHLDIGFLELTDAERVDLGPVRPVQASEIDPNERALFKLPYVGMGYPIKKTSLDPKELRVNASLVRVSGFAKPSALERLGLSGSTHLAFSFDRKRTVVNGIRQPVIKPNGMSGGGVWRYDSYFYERADAGSAKLVAILSEYHENEIKAMISTRIAFFLEVIRQEAPELDKFIPRYTLGQINTTRYPPDPSS